MKILVSPNSMKGSLSSFEFTEAISAGLSSVSDFEIIKLPVADGGDDTAAVIARILNADLFSCKVEDPLGRMIQSSFYMNKDRIAVIDMSSASGLKLLNPDEYSALNTSSYGTGQLIRSSVEAGATKIILGVGGSATVDGGMGALMALGVKFYNKGHEIIRGNGYSTGSVTFIDTAEADLLLKEIEIKVLTDVENPLIGRHGAAFVFGPQKGASPKDVLMLEKNLSLFAGALFQTTGRDVSSIKGGGAAGGIAASFKALFNAEIEKGTDYVLKLSDFYSIAEQCDVIFTGEGIFDNTSFSGKVTGEIVKFAEKMNKHAFLICAKKNLTAEFNLSKLTIVELNCDYSRNKNLNADTYLAIVNKAQETGKFLIEL